MESIKYAFRQVAQLYCRFTTERRQFLEKRKILRACALKDQQKAVQELVNHLASQFNALWVDVGMQTLDSQMAELQRMANLRKEIGATLSELEHKLKESNRALRVANEHQECLPRKKHHSRSHHHNGRSSHTRNACVRAGRRLRRNLRPITLGQVFWHERLSRIHCNTCTEGPSYC